MSNKIYIGTEAREKLMAGVEAVASAVMPTLGANGRNAVYNKFSRVPIITNDGVSIAREVEPEDVGELQGANLIKQVSEKTNDEVGDGTTTSIVLAHSIVSQGIELLNSDSKINPMKLRKEIQDTTQKVLTALKESAIKVSTLEELEHVATISVENAEIGKTIAKAIFDAGDNGIVYVNDSGTTGVTIEKTDGYQFQQGLITPFLACDKERVESVLYNPAILMTEMPLHLNTDFINLITEITKKTKDILIICDEFHPDILKFAVGNLYPRNEQRQILPPKFRMMVVKKPMLANHLQDIAALVSGEVMTAEKGIIKYSLQSIGTCEKIVINQNTTTIFKGAGTNFRISDSEVVNIDTYISNLTSQIESAEDENSKMKLQERLAKLTGGVYMLNVGDGTEAEAKYLRMKVDDAVNATKVAKKDGIVAGGGMALKNVVDFLSIETNGERIILNACLAPLRKIIENSGEKWEEVVGNIKDNKGGFNALTLKIEPDMIKAGIIDPVKVTMSAFSNAASFAGLLLTVESLITPIPEQSYPQARQ